MLARILAALGELLRRTEISVTVPISWTGYKSMKDLITLVDAIFDTYDNRDFQPLPDGTTFCNLGANVVATAMGCKDLAGKTADEILAFIEASDDWSDVPFEKAQDMANAGSLLIAGLDSRALASPHGHVVVVRPGKFCYSGKWGKTPRCLNIGAENFVARARRGPLTNQPCGLNEAFVPLPKIWIWRPSI